MSKEAKEQRTTKYPLEKLSRAESHAYQAEVREAREAAIEEGKPGYQCEASGTLASQSADAARGCGMCKGAIAAAAKQSELTGYDPATEKKT